MGRHSTGFEPDNSHESGPTDEQLLAFGRLHFLASYCPMHSKYPAFALRRLFVPAINNGCVRFFENEKKQVCASLIWARLSREVSERMLYERVPPSEEDWASGETLWFIDLIAPFGQAGQLARYLARNPPPEPFYFARLDRNGDVRKIVRGDRTRPRKKRLRVYGFDERS